MSAPASLARRAAAEALGTFFLVLIGPGAVMVDAYSGGSIGHPGVALSFAFVVLAMIYALGHISGAHINPAVTVAFCPRAASAAATYRPTCSRSAPEPWPPPWLCAPSWVPSEGWGPPCRQCRWERPSPWSGCSPSA